MLETITNNAANLFIDGIADAISQGDIQRRYNNNIMCRDLEIHTKFDLKEGIFSFDLSYRSYPASLKPC